MVRVLHIFHIMDRGGAESMVMNIYRNIDRNKIQFDFLVDTQKIGAFETEINSLGGKIYRLPLKKHGNYIEYARLFDRFLSKNNYKIIHCHMGSAIPVVSVLGRKNGAIVIGHCHSTSSDNKLKLTIKTITTSIVEQLPNYCFACSEKAGNWMFPHRKFKILPNAIDTKKYIYDPTKRKQMREQLGIAEDEFVIGTVGRITVPKNPYKTIEILTALKNRGERFRFLWCGKGEMDDEIHEAAHKAGLDEYIDFLGVRDDIPDILQALDVFLFPSLWEGLPVTEIEAQASGLRVISSDAVTTEADLTDLVNHIPVSASADVWADAILEYKNGYRRRNTQQDIIDAGYDINQSSKWLERFYDRINNNAR